MEISDYLSVDGRQLTILLTIHSAGSLSGAAKMLDMNQSTVSYWLDIMRKRIGDPLFVRNGNGVAPTERAKSLFPAAEAALRHLESIFEPETYDPSEDHGTLRIAATAIERQLLIAPLVKVAARNAPGLTLELQPSGSPFQVIERLRQGVLDLVIMPSAMSEADAIFQRHLLTLEDAVFFDPQFPLQPGDLDAFCARPHARVALGPDAGFDVDRQLAQLGRTRTIALQVPDFDSVAALIQGTETIATLPRQFDAAGLGRIPPPWPDKGLKLAMFWHARNQTSARHKYWRDVLADASKGL